jgi:tyrosyl-DNA phosphodiesterase 2
MAQLVSDFIITPVLRQARRFSSGFAANEAPAIRGPAPHRRRTRSTGETTAAGSAILEGDEHGSLPPGDPALALPNTTEISNRTQQSVAGTGFSPHSPAGPPTSPENVRIAESSPRPTTEPDAPADTLTTNVATPSTTPPAWSLPEGNRSTPLPEDDGMGDLRRRIQAIQMLDVAQDTKAQMMHGLLTEKYTRLQQSQSSRTSQPTVRPVSPASTTARDTPEPPEPTGALHVLKKWNPLGDGSGRLNLPLTEEDLRPTYAPNRRPIDREWWSVGEQPEEEELRLGCEHYRRNVKLQCASCERWYTCRHCHDAVEDHVLPRRQTKHMLCMLCGCAQKASDTCTKCGQSAAYYYCGICKLWNDDPNKPIYHCSDCGLCRVGQGLGKDFFHCKVSLHVSPRSTFQVGD